jgi:AraC-like DNA-binding protein
MSEQNTVLESQKTILVQQFFMLILNGEYHPDIEMQIQTLGVHIPEQFFCVYILQVISPDLFDEEMVCMKINALSEKLTYFFCVRFRYNHSFAVIINTAKESLADNAIEKICNLGSAMNLTIRLMRGKICKNLKSLPISLASALLQGPEASLSTVDLNEGSMYNHAVVSQMLSLLKKNDLRSALLKMDEFTAILKKESPLKFHPNLIFAEVVVSVMKMIHESTPDLMKKAEKVLLCRDFDAFQVEFTGLLEQLHEYLRDHSSNSQKKIHNSILAYIREHALDYDLSYDRLTEEFRLSDKSLRHIIFNETGKTLREYLNILRINSAQELMKSGNTTVLDISQRVGYTNASYFIKVFKNLTGTTPAIYMKYLACEKSALLNSPQN